MIVDFSVMGLFQTNGDTPDYLDTITYFSGKGEYFLLDGINVLYIRLLKPFYGVMGSFLMNIMTPQEALLSMNLFFYFGTVILLFLILSIHLKFRSALAALGSMWFSAGYPILKNGFSLLTDESGYFFIALTIFLAFFGFRQEKIKWFIAAGIAAGLGGLSKETGMLGLLFVVFYCLLDYKKLGIKKTFQIYFLTFIAFGLTLLPITWLIMERVNFTYLDYYNLIVRNQHASQTLKYFIGIQLGAFNLLWPLTLVGIYKILTDKKQYPLLALLSIGLPCPFWVSYEVRYFFVQFPGMIAFSLFGLEFINEKMLKKIGFAGKVTLYLLSAAPIVASLMAFYMIRGSSFWKLIPM